MLVAIVTFSELPRRALLTAAIDISHVASGVSSSHKCGDLSD